MKTINQLYWDCIYNGCVSIDEDMSYEYNQKWNEEVRRMRDNKTLNKKEKKDKNVRIK